MSRYQAYITPEALAEMKTLPGHVRQRVREIVNTLANQPHPSQSKPLNYNDPDRQLFRIRLDNWRVVYAITDSENAIDVLAVRKRPPYDYGDLSELLEEII